MLTFMIIGWVVAGLYAGRAAAGASAWRSAKAWRQTRPDAMDYTGAIIAGLIVTAWGPIATGFLLARRALIRHELLGSMGFTLFPKPQPIETISQKRERLETERRNAILADQHRINREERELGMPITRWETV